MAVYQSFPGEEGDSNSLAKLSCLNLPSLAGKSFLDVGCNEGFFCGYAFFEGASTVIGVDANEDFIKLARLRFPRCRFKQVDWLEFLAGNSQKFDVIICISAIHYARDQPELIRLLVDHLTPDGVLVLEIGIAQENSPNVIDSPRPGWVKCERGIDQRLFPTWQGLQEMLAPYAWKQVNESVEQGGDPLPRYVFHIRKMLPYAVFVFGEGSSGKTTVMRRLFTHLRQIQGDGIWSRKFEAAKYPRLYALAQTSDSPYAINMLVDQMFADTTWQEYVMLVAELAEDKDFVFEGYIPRARQGEFTAKFVEFGYMPLNLQTPQPKESWFSMWRTTQIDTRKYFLYLAALSRKLGV